MTVTKRILMLTALSLSAVSAFAATPSYDDKSAMDKVEKSEKEAVMEKDNTGRNKNQVTTADSQMKGSASDVEVTRKLRERLMSDDQLSTNAKNIKIITISEAITLKGPVANKAEKVKIENYARSMAGKKKVYNRLTY